MARTALLSLQTLGALSFLWISTVTTPPSQFLFHAAVLLPQDRHPQPPYIPSLCSITSASFIQHPQQRVIRRRRDRRAPPSTKRRATDRHPRQRDTPTGVPAYFFRHTTSLYIPLPYHPHTTEHTLAPKIHLRHTHVNESHRHTHPPLTQSNAPRSHNTSQQQTNRTQPHLFLHNQPLCTTQISKPRYHTPQKHTCQHKKTHPDHCTFTHQQLQLPKLDTSHANRRLGKTHSPLTHSPPYCTNHTKNTHIHKTT